MAFDVTTLKNGLRIVGQKMTGVRSAAVGLWVDSGSIYEDVSEAGISHFIEHMLFKGTDKRSAKKIAEEMDMLGGNMNAFTGTENTCFHAKVMDEHLPMAMELISDLVLNSKLTETDIRKEKGVVVEEINMNEDTPDDLVFDLLDQAHYGDQPCSRPVLGTEKSVKALTRAQITDYMGRRYRPDGAVLALCGAYDWEKVVAQAEELYGSWEPSGIKRPEILTQDMPRRVLRREKDIEQVHLCLAYDAPEKGSKEGYPFAIFDCVLGGGMSSRLFQVIREEKGMAYNVYSTTSSTMHSGMLTLYAATSPDHAKTACEMMIEQCDKIAKNGITKKEFELTKMQAIAQLAMSTESTKGNMLSIGRRMLMQGNTKSVDEIIDMYKKTTLDDVNEVAAKYLATKRSAAIVGPKVDDVTDEMIL